MGTSGIAAHYRLSDTPLAITTTVRNQSGEAAASVTLVGPTSDLQPRMAELGRQTPPGRAGGRPAGVVRPSGSARSITQVRIEAVWFLLDCPGQSNARLEPSEAGS